MALEGGRTHGVHGIMVKGYGRRLVEHLSHRIDRHRVHNVPCVTRLHGQAYGYRAHGLVASDGVKQFASVEHLRREEDLNVERKAPVRILFLFICI